MAAHTNRPNRHKGQATFLLEGAHICAGNVHMSWFKKKSIKHKQKNDTPNSTKHYLFFFPVTKYLTSSTNSSTVFQRTEQKIWIKSFSRLARLVNFLKVIVMDCFKDIFLSSQMHKIFNKVSRTSNKWNWGKPDRLFLEDFSHFPVFFFNWGHPLLHWIFTARLGAD